MEDVRSLKALAHPLRVELLDLLRFEGPSTASALAKRLGESSGATSYHLRQLARHSFIEQDERPSRGRERWWRHRERMVSVGQPGAPAEAAAAIELVSREARALERFLADREQVAEWEGAFLRSRALRLSPAGLRQLELGIAALIDSLPTADASDAPDAVPVRFLALGFPQIRED